MGGFACPGEEVNFTCTVRGSSNLTSLSLSWSSAEYIGMSGFFLQFTADMSPGKNMISAINRDVVATLTKNTNVSGVPILESTLRIVVVRASVINCSSGISGHTESIKFSISGIYKHACT